MLFRKWGCLVGPENSIFRKLKSVDRKKMSLTTEIDLHFYFPFKAFPENERGRESACVRERRSVKRDLVVARSRRWSRSRLREIAPDRDRDQRWERKIRDRDMSYVGREIREEDSSRKIARFERKIRRSRSRERRSRSREEGKITIAPSIAILDRDRQHDLGCSLCFSGFVFSFFFSKH